MIAAASAMRIMQHLHHQTPTPELAAFTLLVFTKLLKRYPDI